MAHNFCGSCGAPVKPGARFCARCGAPIEAAAPETAETALMDPVAEAPATPQAATPAPDGGPAQETRAMPQAATSESEDFAAQETRAMPQATSRPPASGFAAPGSTARMPPVAAQATGPQQRVYSSQARPAAPMDAQKKGLIAGIVAAVVVIVVLVALFVVPALANRGQSAGTTVASSVASSQNADDSSQSSATDASSSSDAAGSSSSSAAAATSSSSSSASAADEATYQALLAAYDDMGSADQAISACATTFNSVYLSSDFDRRIDAANEANSVQQEVSGILQDLQGLGVSSGSPYYGDYTVLLQLQNDLQHRIDVICEAWDIDLQYQDDAKSFESTITEPLGRDKVNGSNKYKQDFDKVYPTAQPQQR